MNDDYEGAGVAAFALATAILKMLVEQDILSREKVGDVLDQSILALENQGVTDGARKKAHSLLETILRLNARGASQA